MPPLSVLHYIGYDSDRGGIVSVVRTLAQTGRFDCILGVNVGFRQLRVPRLEAIEMPPLVGERIDLRNALKARIVAKSVEKWLNGGPNRVFHGHSRAGMLVAMWLARRHCRRIIVSVHCYGKHRWFYRWCARSMGDRVYWLSPAMKAYYGVKGGATWSQCIPGCVPMADMKPMEARRGAPNPLRIGGIGAIERWKGWDLVLRAIAALPEMVRERVRFSHIGSASSSTDSRNYSDELRGLTKSLNLGASVEWRGEQPSAKNLLNEVDCLVIASRNEPFSAAMLEALASGVPVLAADSGGARDIIDTPRNGWLFRSGDAGYLSRSLSLLLETEAWAGIRIEPEDLTRFSATHVAEQWANVYGNLLAADSKQSVPEGLEMGP